MKQIKKIAALVMAAVMLTACACSKKMPTTEETQVEVKTGFLEASEEPAAYDYAIEVSINPCITLFVWDEQVQAWRFDNEDAKFAYYGIDFEGMSPEAAVVKVVETAVEAGYVEGGNDVKMTVLDKGAAPEEEYVQSLTDAIADVLADKVEEVQVVTETAPAPVVEETPTAETTEETKEETKEEVKTESKGETKETTQSTQPAQQQPAQQSQQSPAQEEHQHSWVHHDAEYQTVHHDAEYSVVHHDAEYTYVHHDAEYQTVHHDAVVDVSYPYMVYYHYKCRGCGALSVDPPTCECLGGYTSGNFGVADSGPAVEVVLSPAYDEQILVKAAYDEQVLVKEAYDETVLVKEAYDEQVLVRSAYDECSSCGATR